jgi:SulP family sulfate permease
LVFIKRMSDGTEVESAPEGIIQRDDLLIYRLHGPVFFGSAAQIGGVLDRIADRPRRFVIDFSDVPMIDSSGARSFEVLARKLHRKGGQLCVLGARPEVRRVLLAQGVREPEVRYLVDLEGV